jgi:hypothetical protein
MQKMNKHVFIFIALLLAPAMALKGETAVKALHVKE